jgi:hypothetical protein
MIGQFRQVVCGESMQLGIFMRPSMRFCLSVELEGAPPEVHRDGPFIRQLMQILPTVALVSRTVNSLPILTHTTDRERYLVIPIPNGVLG